MKKENRKSENRTTTERKYLRWEEIAITFDFSLERNLPSIGRRKTYLLLSGEREKESGEREKREWGERKKRVGREKKESGEREKKRVGKEKKKRVEERER